MIFTETLLRGAFVIEMEKHMDERGFFARTFCCKEFENHGLESNFVQCNISYNTCKGTLRGMHYQVEPKAEAKLVLCTKGAIYDVIIDLRHDSPTYCQWISTDLKSDEYRMLFVPEGLAHGFQTLENDTEVFYQMSEFYSPEHVRGVRWDDPVFGIRWPDITNRIISGQDNNFPLMEPNDE